MSDWWGQDWLYFRYPVRFVPTVQNGRGRLNPVPHLVAPTVPMHFHGSWNGKKTSNTANL